MKQKRDTGKMTPAEIRQAAYHAITRELGPSGLIRFIQDTSLGSGDYLKDRRNFLPKGTVRDIAHQITEWRRSTNKNTRKGVR